MLFCFKSNFEMIFFGEKVWFSWIWSNKTKKRMKFFSQFYCGMLTRDCGKLFSKEFVGTI